MDVEMIDGNPIAVDIEHIIRRMEHIRIEESSLVANMPELNKSTKVAQEAHSNNKNEEVAEPELNANNNYGSMKLVDLASFDPAHFTYMPCYDNIVLLDLDEGN